MNAPNLKRSAPGKLTFRVKPRLLRLLGDQLIRDANLAVFELVKNAYDADATECSVLLEHPNDVERARIVITDNGDGMSEEILRDVWMMIATDFREDQRNRNKRTDRGRFPLGEKGLGRLSIHKLGKFIRLITRARNDDEFVLVFDWERLENAENLDQAVVNLERRHPEVFKGRKHGTRLEVTQLRETWSRGELRRLHRAVNSLCSPFDSPEDFKVLLAAPGCEEWLKGLLTPEKVNQSALYHVRGAFEGRTAEFTYTFTPPPEVNMQLTGRKEQLSSIPLQKRLERKYDPIDLSEHQIGRVEFEFRIFDRDSAVIRAVTDDVRGLKSYLDENGGIRIYRDGIRVYDFGEPGNDWLNLDLRRVNTPVAKTSNNQILGALRLDATQSGDLREKSNREGFIQNAAFEALKDAVISVLTHVEAEKTLDQKRLRKVFGKGTGQKIFAKMTDLRETLARKGVLAEVEKKLDAVEKEMEIYRDQLLHAAVPGLTIGIMLHGAEKILEELREAARRKADPIRIQELVDRLYRAMRPITNLLKNPSTAKTCASTLIKEARFSSEFRLKRHGITLVNGLDEGNCDFTIEGSKQMLVACITNLIDNAIHWMEVKNPVQKLLYLGTTQDLEGGPAIVVADNGPGFKDEPEDLVAPFFTRRNGGMGLGLYIVDEVMRVNKGRLVFPDRGDVAISREFCGAVVALQFLKAP